MKKEYLKREDWATDVKAALNRFIERYGKDAPEYDGTSYVVFDFDNTVSIYDAGDQAAIYQLNHMAFAMTPSELRNALLFGVKEPEIDCSSYSGCPGTFLDWVEDICTAYAHLYETYGPFTYRGVTPEQWEALHRDLWWQEFSAKMRMLYRLAYVYVASGLSWLVGWYSGMTWEEEVAMAAESHREYDAVPSQIATWNSPKALPSRVGSVSCSFVNGISVTKNMQELLQALNDNGIAVWICSASPLPTVVAAVDYWGLHDAVTGVLGMVNVYTEDGRQAPGFDYETGTGMLSVPGGWEKDSYPVNAEPNGPGKAEALEHTLCRRYGHGPLAGFMDASGDYNFCTEFPTLKLVTCFNRGNRKVTDGGGIVAALAIHQREVLGYDLDRANAAGDTLYVLQGRDASGPRCFLPGNASIPLGCSEPRLFAGEENERMLRVMNELHMTTEQAVNAFAIRTEAKDPENILGGICYGFLEHYGGYHSRNFPPVPGKERLSYAARQHSLQGRTCMKAGNMVSLSYEDS